MNALCAGTGEAAMEAGARKMTHLFNAMSAFHHRDPGLVGLLASDDVYRGVRQLYYGLIVDGFHTHAAALRIAHAAHPKGCFIVRHLC
jgi:N-acetylglucosamine-6-phosphate deacetylase